MSNEGQVAAALGHAAEGPVEASCGVTGGAALLTPSTAQLTHRRGVVTWTQKQSGVSQISSIDSYLKQSGVSQISSIDSYLKQSGVSQISSIDSYLKQSGVSQISSVDSY